MQKDLMELVDGCSVYETPNEAKGEEVISEYRELGFLKATEEAYQENLESSKQQRIYEFEYRVITTDAIRKFLQRKVKLYDKEHKLKPKKKTLVANIGALGSAIGDQYRYINYLSKLVLEGIPVEGSTVKESPESDVFDTAALERMRDEVMRCVGIPEPMMGISENLRSAQEKQIQRVAYAYSWNNRIEARSIYEKTCDYDKYDPKTIGRFEWKEERVEDYEGLPPAPVIKTFKEHKTRKVFDYFTIASVNDIPDPLLLGRINGDDDNRWFIAQWGKDVCLDDLI